MERASSSKIKMIMNRHLPIQSVNSKFVFRIRLKFNVLGNPPLLLKLPKTQAKTKGHPWKNKEIFLTKNFMFTIQLNR